MIIQPPLLAKDVLWDREHPCNDCPFVRTSPMHQGIARSLPEYLSSIERGVFAHTCHKTDNRPECDGPRNFDGEPRHCAGAILMLLKTGKGYDLQLPLLQAVEAGKLDIEAWAERAKRSSLVFTWGEMLRFYSAALAKLLTRAECKRRRRDRKKARKR